MANVKPKKKRNKLKSRKLWAWLLWSGITLLTLIFARDNISVVIPWYGIVTTLYIGGQAAIDAVEKIKGA